MFQSLPVTLLASVSIFVGSLALGGCYTLSAPDGPRPEDFEAQNNSAAAAQENDDTEAPVPVQANCPDGTCAPTPVASLETKEPTAKWAEPRSPVDEALFPPTGQK